ncbi:hypothetical protein LJR290_002978 [Variovorax sp. LjRoot290]|uniref:hypothetical protein n=1 Tax=unclassified Variovorax TaxID=663243 RepID=UPI003ECF5EDA
MALICPQCKTKNRSAAKFCIECIGTLPTAFASADAPRASAANSLFGFMRRAEQSQGPAAVGAAPAVAEAAQTFSKGMWVSIAALSVALIVGAAGWLVAGAGGWYLYTAGKAQVHPVRTDPSAQTEQRAASPAATAEAPAMVTEPQTEKVQLAPTKAPDPVRATSEPAQAKSVKAPRSAAATAPGQACSGMNFVVAARCMAAQCEKAEFRAHAQCTAVRRQQLLEEQKRNPAAP